jgi:hypothetical protein
MLGGSSAARLLHWLQARFQVRNLRSGNCTAKCDLAHPSLAVRARIVEAAGRVS